MRLPRSSLPSALGVALLACGVEGERRGTGTAPPVVPADLERMAPALRDVLRHPIAAVEREPGSAQAHAQLGLVYEANRLWPWAADCYRNADRLGAPGPSATYRLGVCLEKLGEEREALELYRRTAREHPDYAPAIHRLGDLLLESGALDEAARAFQRVIALEPEQLAGHVGLATVELRRGEAASVVERMQPWVASLPAVKLPHFLLGSAYMELGRQEEGERELALGAGGRKVYLADESSRLLTRFNIGLGVEERLELAAESLDGGDAEQAVEVLRVADERAPGDPRVLSRLGRALLALDRDEEARRHLERAAALDPDDHATQRDLAELELRSGRGREALARLDLAQARAPQDAALWVLRGRALLALGDASSALHAFDEAARLDPGDVDALMGAGSALVAMDRTDEALERFQRVTRTRPAYVQAQLVLIQLYLKAGDTGRARQQLTAARAAAPDHPQLEALAQRLGG